MFKVGDKLQCINDSGDDADSLLCYGTIYTFRNYYTNGGIQLMETGTHFYNVSSFLKIEEKVESKNMLKEVMLDVKEFVKNNRNVIYTIVTVALVDHFVFKGALRERLKALIEKMLSKAEKSVE